MSIIGSIRAEYTEKALKKCIDEINNLDIEKKEKVIELLHKYFDGLCLE